MNTCPAHSTACQSGVIGVFLVVCCLMNQDFARVHCVANHDGALKLKRFLYEVAEDGLGIHEMQKAFDDNAAVNKSIDPARKLKKLAQSVKKILDDAKKAVKKLKKSFEEEFEKFSRTHNPWKLCTSLQIQDLKWDDFTKNYVRNEACEIQAPNEKNASAFWYITKNVIDKAKNNKKELQNLILWQYWADKNGLLTIYPALKKTNES
ncbi:uncharacterized protein LOC111089849 [Limulus polyphemus]|uniref:Uncharacterized protein LOC111089849 n=1 Tax=Limulus polyphemus TaxID=6850 RepID=A0ABM1TS85_LIMPO|nr:uncharacterized protein LOC111089849 [Limulus polyphemus]